MRTHMWILCVLLTASQPLGLRAAEPKPVAITAITPTASIIARSRTDQPWRTIEQGAILPENETLVAFPEAAIESADHGLRLTAMSDFEGKSPFPILETSFTLHTPTAEVMDVDLDRGRIHLENRRASGAASVRVRFVDEEWIINLEQPGTQVAVERFGRWKAGARFSLKPTAKDEPSVFVVLVVLKGEISLETKRHRYRLNAPPGPAMLQWDSETKSDASPQRLSELPSWAIAEEKPSATVLTYRKWLEQFRQLRVEKGIPEAIDSLYRSKDPIGERIALVTMGATDDLPRLGRALQETSSPVIWDFGVVVARHWIGRGPGAEQELYSFLVQKQKLNPAHARTILELLLGFDADMVREPECYELLIEYLQHEKPTIRNLAGWHLNRLVPKLRSTIPFTPNASPEESRRAYLAWKAAIPTGRIPSVILPPR